MRREAFDWFARRILLAGLPGPVTEACLADRQVRSLLLFRFAYVFTAHASVLVPLLEAFTGGEGPGIALLSLGFASLVMVFAEVPGGVYADRAGPKAALRLGLLLMGLAMLGFLGLGAWRWSAGPSEPHEVLPLGVAGVFVLELLVGVALSLINGADTVLFMSAAARLKPAVDSQLWEATGSSIRYAGTMAAVGIGAVWYHLVGECFVEAWQLPLQCLVFVMTLFAQAVALRALGRIDEVRADARPRPPLWRALADVARLPALAVLLWQLCLIVACAFFAVYFFQSPLNKAALHLARQTPLFVPAYALVMMLGWWSSARGSRGFRWYRNGLAAGVGPADEAVQIVGIGAVFFTILCFLPVLAGGQEAAVLVGGGLVLISFNFARGFFEPFARTRLVRHSDAASLHSPASLVSAYIALQRCVHLTLSLVYFLFSRGEGDASVRDGLLATVAAVAALAALGGLVVLVVSRLARRAEGDAPRRVPFASAVVVGSYKVDFQGLLRIGEVLRTRSVRVLHPPSSAVPNEVDGDFVRLNCDESRDEGEVQRQVLAKIDAADVLVVYDPNGRIGVSCAFEIGYAHARGKPIFAVRSPADAMLRKFMDPLPGVQLVAEGDPEVSRQGEREPSHVPPD